MAKREGVTIEALRLTLHFDCAACQARTGGIDGERATLVLLLSMLRDGLTADDYYVGLCFEHRRRINVLLDDAKRGA